MAETQDVRRDSGLPTAKNGNGGELEDVLTGGAVFKIAALDDTREQGSAEDHCELHGINIKPLHSLSELTPQWLSLFLDRSIADDGFSTQPVGTGQMSSTFRVTFHEAGSPDEIETLVVKFASSDPETRELGIRFQHYQREAIFYRRFGAQLQAGLNKCYGAVVDQDGWFTLVLEDAGKLDGYTCGQLEGTDYEHCALVLRSLARLQAPVLGKKELDDDAWLNAPGALDQKLFNDCLPVFLKRFPVNEEMEKLLYWMSEHLDDWYATRNPPFAISHGDFRLDNIMFLKGDGDRAVAVDWGGSNWCSPMRDAAYFLGNGLKVEDRRRWEKQLVREYLDELNALSDVRISWEHAWSEYSRETIYGLAQHIPAAGILPDTDRGKIMFRTLVTRQAQHALDLHATSFVKPGTARIRSLRPPNTDESEHSPPADSGPLRNESWYFDAVAPDGSLGMYARIGRLPSQQCCTFLAGIFRQGEPPLMVVDMHAPLPSSDLAQQRLETESFVAECECLEPLEAFAFRMKGKSSVLADPSAPLRGDNAGTGQENVELDLVWKTVGHPYKKRSQTRYEIPCAITGTIKIGTQTHTLQAAPGERNHSWGVRDWWVHDWVWSSLHFENGTHIFTIALGRGAESSGAADFMQRDCKLTEIESVVNDFEWGDDGLPGSLRLSILPHKLIVFCEPIAAAGLRLLSPEGKEAHLPRIMCRARLMGPYTHLNGVGWLDFNRVIRS